MSRRGPLEAELYEQYIEQGMDEMSAEIMAAEIAADAGENVSGYRSVDEDEL
jgi:hypothetical protein